MTQEGLLKRYLKGHYCLGCRKLLREKWEVTTIFGNYRRVDKDVNGGPGLIDLTRGGWFCKDCA